MRMLLRRGVMAVGWLLAALGGAAAVLAAMIAVPVSRPPALTALTDAFRDADRSGIPPLGYFQARDGTQLAYRRYPAAGATAAGAILVHGSSGSSLAMHTLAKGLAARGVASIAPDIRGHGASGTRGDIGYLGQLEDDLADLAGHIRAGGATEPLTLIGHSSGGGFALRVAGSGIQDLFTRTILLAPWLGPEAASSRPDAGGWASPNLPRIIALSLLRSVGIACCDQLPVIAFAVPQGSARFLTAEYSLRLLANFGTHRDYRGDLDAARGPITLIAGADDSLMAADRYADAVRGSAARIEVRVLDNIDHVGIVSAAPAIAAIADAIVKR